MKHGPVPSGTYDILKHVRGDGLSCFVPHPKESFRIEDDKLVVPFRDANLDLLSDSERDSLDAAIATYGTMSFGQLTELSHDKAWDSADESEFIAVEQIVATLPDAEQLLEHLTNRHLD